MKKNRIIVIADEGEVLWESLILPGTTDRDLSSKKYSGRSFPLDSIFLSFDFNCGKARTGNYSQLVETTEDGVTPVIVLLPDHSEMRK